MAAGSDKLHPLRAVEINGVLVSPIGGGQPGPRQMRKGPAADPSEITSAGGNFPQADRGPCSLCRHRQNEDRLQSNYAPAKLRYKSSGPWWSSLKHNGIKPTMMEVTWP